VKRNLIAAIAGGAAAAASMLTSPNALAWDNVHWSVNVGIPGVLYPAYPPPLYSQPVPIYRQPVYGQPVYGQPQPVYVEPPVYESREVYVTSAPVYYLNSPQPYYWNHGRRMYGYAPAYGPSYRQGWYDRQGYWHR
jgi:hypothetical protein